MPSQLIKNTFREDRLPHIWCPGCGHGILMRDVAQAIDNLGLNKDDVCIVSGIGCSSRAAGYMDFNTLHTTHGRAIAFATGIKLAKPEMKVIVITGDGDASAIGGNHLIHACRRNIDLTVVIFNNNIYGMTGGQYSPTTPTNEYGTTAPYGNIDNDFDIPQLAIAAGATYVARGTAYHVPQTIKMIEEGIKNPGFSLIEGVSICPTYYGRKNKKGSAVKMMLWQKDNTMDLKKIPDPDYSQVKNKIVMGVFKNEPKEEYTARYQKIIERSGGNQ